MMGFAAREGGGLSLVAYGFLALVALLLFLPGFFDLPPVDRDEARFVQASRQMVESGDYVDIRFQDQPRYKKPAGVYWLQAGAALLSGEREAAPIWVFRLPSLLGAIASVLLVAWAGSRLFGASAALLAALAFSACLLLGMEARLAKSDAVLLATVLLAQGALARVYLQGRQGFDVSWGPPLLFWLAIGLGILVKGPIGPMVSALTLLALGFSDKRWRWMLGLRPWAGLPLALAIAAPWLIAIHLLSEGAFLEQSLGGDLLAKLFQGQESHGAPPGYYLLTFWITAWPFGFLALAGLLAAWRRREDPAVRFCLAWLLPSWLLFELVATKLPHYVLPAFPPLFLLLAWRLTLQDPPPLGQRQAWIGKAGWWLLAASGGVLALASLAVPLLLRESLVWWSAPAALAATLATWLALRMQPGRPVLASFAGLLLAAGVFQWSAFQGVLPRLQSLWVSPRVAAAVERLGPCIDSRLVAAGYTEPSLAVLVGTGTLLGSAEAAAAHLRDAPACALAMIEERSEARFRAALAEHNLEAVALERLEGFNYSRMQPVTLTFYRAVER